MVLKKKKFWNTVAVNNVRFSEHKDQNCKCDPKNQGYKCCSLRDSYPQTHWLYESIMEHMQLVLKNYSLCYIIQLCWIHNWFALKEHQAVPQGALNKETATDA